MSGDRSVSLWEVKIPIKGLISPQQDGLKMDNVEFHLYKDGCLAKTVLKGSPDDIRDEAIERVNRALDKIAFELDASIRIEKSGIKGKQISKPFGETTGEVLCAWEDITIKLIHPFDEYTLSKAATLGLNIQDNDKKRTFQKSLSHYRNGLNAESDGNPRAFLDFWDSIEVIAGKYGKGKNIKDKIYDCFEKCLGERREDEVKKLYKIRQDAAHGLKDVSDPEEIKVMIEKTPQMKDFARQFLISWSRKKAQNFEFLS